MKKQTVLVVLVLVRLLVLAALALMVVEFLPALIWRLENPHGAAKVMLITWQSLLRRHREVLALAGIVLVAACVLPSLSGRWRWVGAALFSPLVLCVQPTLVFIGALLHLLTNLLPWSLPSRWAWLPGSEILLPVPLARRLGLWPRLLAPGAVLLLLGFWLVADTLVGFKRYDQALFQPWPAAFEDPRVEVIERAVPPTRCDYSDIDIVGDRTIVVAEWTHRLISYPSGATHVLPPIWGPPHGDTMDSETDPATGITYYQGGGDYIASVAWEDGRWVPSRRSSRFPEFLPLTQMNIAGDHLQVLLIGAYHKGAYPSVVDMELPSMSNITSRPLRRSDGSLLPTARYFEWLPSIERMVVVPDMGRQLFLVDLSNAIAEPWIQVPTLDGRPVWSEELGRLLLPVPTEGEVWLIEPVTGDIRRIQTEPGTRTAAVDVGRGLLLSASILTGRVLVQRLETGEVVDHFGLLMPMVRKLVVNPDKGEAWLSTWTTLYRIPYADSGEVESHTAPGTSAQP